MIAVGRPAIALGTTVLECGGRKVFVDRLSSRVWFGAIALICVGLMAYAFYAQYVLKLEPCPLCMFQRVAVVLIGTVSAIAAVHGPARLGSRIYAVFGFLASVLGLLIAGRHIWLQSLPKDQLPSCAPPLDFMWNNFPFGDMLRTVLMTSGECANIDWRFLGFSMPAWTFVCFAGLAVVMLVFVVFPPGKAPVRA